VEYSCIHCSPILAQGAGSGCCDSQVRGCFSSGAVPNALRQVLSSLSAPTEHARCSHFVLLVVVELHLPGPVFLVPRHRSSNRLPVSSLPPCRLLSRFTTSRTQSSLAIDVSTLRLVLPDLFHILSCFLFVVSCCIIPLLSPV